MEIPERFGRYQVVRELGRGGMATVFLCTDTRLNRSVAVKVLASGWRGDHDIRGRFEREARIVAQLKHEAIVAIYDVGEHEGLPYLVMAYMPNGTLADRMRAGTLDDDLALGILGRVADALDAAHAAGIVHRDLKPGNILFDAEDRPHVADFGIARLLDGDATLTGNRLVGTPAYMSPEQAEGARVGAASDTYSLGVMAFELLTGQLPFSASSPFAVARKHIQEIPPLASVVRPGLSQEVDEAFEAALAKDPEARPATATAFVAELRESVTAVKAPPRTGAGPGSPTIEVPPLPITVVQHLASPHPRVRRSMMLGTLAVTVLLGGAVIGGLVAFRRSGESEPGTAGVVEYQSTELARITLPATPAGDEAAVAVPETVTPTPTLAGPRTYLDDFTNPSTGLMRQLVSGARTASYEAGAFVIRQTAPMDNPVGVLAKYIYADVDISVTVEAVEGTNLWLGMGCQNKWPEAGGYYFWIDPLRQRVLLGVAGPVAGYNLIEWAPYSAVRSIGPNRMRLRCRDGEITVAVNDGPEIVARDSTWDGGGTFSLAWGSIGSELAPAGSVKYTNLQLTTSSDPR